MTRESAGRAGPKTNPGRRAGDEPTEPLPGGGPLRGRRIGVGGMIPAVGGSAR